MSSNVTVHAFKRSLIHEFFKLVINYLYFHLVPIRYILHIFLSFHNIGEICIVIAVQKVVAMEIQCLYQLYV